MVKKLNFKKVGRKYKEGIGAMLDCYWPFITVNVVGSLFMVEYWKEEVIIIPYLFIFVISIIVNVIYYYFRNVVS